MPASTAEVMWPSDCRSRMILRSWSTGREKASITWSSISRCCPVRQVTTRKTPRRFNSSTTGAILMASGRVPKVTNTVRQAAAHAWQALLVSGFGELYSGTLAQGRGKSKQGGGGPQ